MSAQPYTPEEIASERKQQEYLLRPAADPLDWSRGKIVARWLATVDSLTSRLDAATRRADEVESLLREVQPHLIARTLSPTPHPWEVRDEMAKAELLSKIDAALRIDAAKEGRHA